MSPIVPFTSFGLVESVWLIGGVFSALKALRLSRTAKPQNDEPEIHSVSAPAGPTADRPPVRRGARVAPNTPVAPKTPVAPAVPVLAPPTLLASATGPLGSDEGGGVRTTPEVLPDEIGLQILVAEDNPINRKVMQLLLRRMGYEADIAVDGEQAVEMAAAKPYDAILMDLHMPRMGGIEATEAILSQLVAPPRVVAVTADVTHQARAECQRVGMAAYLTKPVDSNLLLHELKEAEAHRATLGRTG